MAVLYSRHRDVYKLPAMGKDLWLSVQVYPLTDFGRKGGATVGAARCADGSWWRAYRSGGMFQGGQTVAVPDDDSMVVDYLRELESPIFTPSI